MVRLALDKEPLWLTCLRFCVCVWTRRRRFASRKVVQVWSCGGAAAAPGGGSRPPFLIPGTDQRLRNGRKSALFSSCFNMHFITFSCTCFYLKKRIHTNLSYLESGVMNGVWAIDTPDGAPGTLCTLGCFLWFYCFASNLFTKLLSQGNFFRFTEKQIQKKIVS